MTLNNAYKIYSVLHKQVHQQEENETDRLKPLSMDEVVEELTYSLLQGGGDVRRRTVYHPPAQRIYNMYSIVMEESNNKLIWIDGSIL